jgi:capping protein (actin filament) muscle Z-line, beta
MADLVDSMLDLMRRLPPTRVEENVAALVGICPDYADDLLGSVDQPLQLRTDRATGREYLACDYNRDGESYRWVSMLFICKLRLGAITCYVEQIALVKRV